MLDIQVWCKRCGEPLETVEEYPDGYKYQVKVEPCSECIKEAAQQSAQPTAETCANCGEPRSKHKGRGHVFCPGRPTAYASRCEGESNARS